MLGWNKERQQLNILIILLLNLIKENVSNADLIDFEMIRI